MVIQLYCIIFAQTLNTMRTLTVSPKTFTNMLSGLIASGVTFEAEELSNGNIKIEFLGGY